MKKEHLRDNCNVSWVGLGIAFQNPSNTMGMCIERFREVADLPPKIISTKRIIAPVISREVNRFVKENPKTLYGEIPKLLEESLPNLAVTPSVSSIRRQLTSSGYKKIKLLNKALIHSRNIEKRRKYAENHKDAEFWDAVIWSDETFVKSMPNGKEVRFYVHRSTKRLDLPVNWQIQGGGFSVMFWGCFSKMGLGPLVALEGSQTAESYIETLENNFINEYLAAEDELRHKYLCKTMHLVIKQRL